MAGPCDIRGELLQLLASGPASLRPLIAKHRKWDVYRTCKQLRAEGLVIPGPKPSTWQLSTAGQEAAAAPSGSPAPTTSFTWPTLPVARAHLDVLPSVVHQSLGRLILLSATVRRAYEHHHASFLLYSALGLKGKTFMGRWSVLTLGGGEVVHAVAEGGRSLGARRKADGQVAAVRAALSSPVLMIDEWRRGTADVRRITTLLIHGDRSIPVEAERLDVRAVVLLAMNSVAGAADVEAATGLDAAMIRRCFAACLEHVELDVLFKRDGEERLDRVRALGALTLPDVRVDPALERQLRDRIADALEAVLDSPERIGSLDLVLLGQLAMAAVAWGLSLEDAVALVVHDACVVWATTGWTAAGWEAELAGVLGRDVPVQAEVVEAASVVVEGDFGEYDYELRLMNVDRAIRDAGVGLEELPALLADGAALRRHGLRDADLHGLRVLAGLVRGPGDDAGAAVERLKVLETMDRLGVTPGEGQRLIEAAMAGRDVLRLEAEDVVLVMRGITEAGLEPAEVGGWLVEVMAERARLDLVIETTRVELRDWQRRRLAAAEDVAHLQRRVRALGRVLERAEADAGLAAALGLGERELGLEVVAEVLALAREVEAGRPG